MPGAIASVPQLAQPGGDIHEAAEDSLNRIGAIPAGERPQDASQVPPALA
jgi:hypothetical protein